MIAFDIAMIMMINRYSDIASKILEYSIFS